jgi:hypothetical protein
MEYSKGWMTNSVIGMCNLYFTVVLLQVTKVDFKKARTNQKPVLRSLDPNQGELWNSQRHSPISLELDNFLGPRRTKLYKVSMFPAALLENF